MFIDASLARASARGTDVGLTKAEEGIRVLPITDRCRRFFPRIRWNRRVLISVGVSRR